MNVEVFEKLLTDYVLNSPDNRISESAAIYPELAGVRIYDAPLIGYASADDSLFYNEFRTPGIIHPDHKTPKDWLFNSRTVISFFLPFSEEVRRSNYTDVDESYAEGHEMTASALWLHGRIEGQAFMAQVCWYVQRLLLMSDYRAVCPAIDPGFGMPQPLVSNWSERHVAYAAGLGTFGLSKGLITKRGMAGRFGSIVTDAEFPITERPYSSPFEYCTMCGKCAKRCPVNAIDPRKGVARGKDHVLCHAHVYGNQLPPHGEKGVVRFGCGKCQVDVPCEFGIPGRKA